MAGHGNGNGHGRGHGQGQGHGHGCILCRLPGRNFLNRAFRPGTRTKRPGISIYQDEDQAETQSRICFFSAGNWPCTRMFRPGTRGPGTRPERLGTKNDITNPKQYKMKFHEPGPGKSS